MYKIVLVLCFCFVFSGAFAQTNTSNLQTEFGGWASLSFKKKIDKKWDVSLNLVHRRRDNLYQLRSNFVEIKLTRDLPNKWTTAVYVRPIQTAEENRIRFSHAINKSVKFSKLAIKYRLKHDLEHAFPDNSNVWDLTLRNKIGLQYKLKELGLKPALFVEINNDYEERFLDVDRVRFKGEVGYEINKKMEVELTYIVQQQLNVVYPRRDYILSIGLSYDI